MNETKWLRLNYSKKDCTQLEECYLLLWSKVSRAHSDYVFLHLVFYCLVIPGRAANISFARITRVWYGKKNKALSLFCLNVFNEIRRSPQWTKISFQRFRETSNFRRPPGLPRLKAEEKFYAITLKNYNVTKKSGWTKKKKKRKGSLPLSVAENVWQYGRFSVLRVSTYAPEERHVLLVAFTLFTLRCHINEALLLFQLWHLYTLKNEAGFP